MTLKNQYWAFVGLVQQFADEMGKFTNFPSVRFSRDGCTKIIKIGSFFAELFKT